MSLVVKDMLLTGLVALSGAAVIYVQYFASYTIQQYAVWSWVAFIITSLFFLRFSDNGRSVVSYMKASRGELRKIVWPNRQDVVWTTFAVGIAVIVFSILVSVLDSMLVWGLSGLIG